LISIPPIIVGIIFLVSLALLNTYVYGEAESLVAFFIIATYSTILLVLSFVPLTMVNSLRKSKGRELCYRKPKEDRDELDECSDCCSGRCWI